MLAGSPDTPAQLAAKHLAGRGLGHSMPMAQTSGPEPPKRGMHRTVTGSHMDLSEMESLIAGASTRGQETETSSIASSSQTGRSNIVQASLKSTASHENATEDARRIAE